MYHPTRGGVRGGRDQFNWDDVKVDKHRENYLGHSLKAPVGRWQKGKDLNWYARDKKSKSDGSNSDAIKEEIKRIKEEEEQAMREALGLAPKRSAKTQGNRLDKHELAELVKRGSTAEDLGAGHADAAQVQGLGFDRGSLALDETSLPTTLKAESVKMDATMPTSSARNEKEDSEDERSRKKVKHEERRREEKKREKHESREKRHSRDSDDKKKHKKHSEKKRRHDSD